MEVIFVTLSCSHTSMVPDFVAENMKSLFTANRWMSEQIESDPMTALLGRENTFTSMFVRQETEIMSSSHVFTLNKLVMNEKMCVPFRIFHQLRNHQQTQHFFEFGGNRYSVFPTTSWHQHKMLLMFESLNQLPAISLLCLLNLNKIGNLCFHCHVICLNQECEINSEMEVVFLFLLLYNQPLKSTKYYLDTITCASAIKFIAHNGKALDIFLEVYMLGNP